MKDVIKLRKFKKLMNIYACALAVIVAGVSAFVVWATESDLISIFGAVVFIIILIAALVLFFICTHKIETIEEDCDTCYFRCKVLDTEASLYIRFNELVNEYYNECNKNYGREGTTRSLVLRCEIEEVQNLMKQICMENIPEFRRMN